MSEEQCLVAGCIEDAVPGHLTCEAHLAMARVKVAKARAERKVGATDRMGHGGDRRSKRFKASREAFGRGKAAAGLAAQLGVSQATIERIHAVMDSDEEEIKARLEAGEIAPYTAYRLVKQAYGLKKASKGVQGRLR